MIMLILRQLGLALGGARGGQDKLLTWVLLSSGIACVVLKQTARQTNGLCPLTQYPLSTKITQQ